MIYKSAVDHLVDPLWPQMVSCPVHWPDPPFLSQTKKKVKMNVTQRPAELCCALNTIQQLVIQKSCAEVERSRNWDVVLFCFTANGAALHMTRPKPGHQSCAVNRCCCCFLAKFVQLQLIRWRFYEPQHFKWPLRCLRFVGCRLKSHKVVKLSKQAQKCFRWQRWLELVP